MQTFSETLRAAIAARTPQRALIVFTMTPDGTMYDPAVEFTNEDILVTNGLKLKTEFNTETDLTIGFCPSAEIQFDMLNDRSQLADFEFGTFTAYLGARIDTGTPAQTAVTRTYTEHGKQALYEFAPLGVFIAERPDVVMKKAISVTANDQMTLFDIDMPDAATLGITYPVTLYGLVSAMCDHVGVTLGSASWLNSTISVASAPTEFENVTMRDVLKWVAEAGCCTARFGRDGALQFCWFNQTNVALDEGNYAEFAATWYETKAIDSLHIRNDAATTELVLGTGDNAYLIQGNPFLKQSGGQAAT